jgi:hypothetical protein
LERLRAEFFDFKGTPLYQADVARARTLIGA